MEDKKRCWICDSICNLKRIEEHHVYGRSKDKTVDLCLVCHDLLDRSRISDLDIRGEFMKASEEISRLPPKDTKYMRLFLLKITKAIFSFKEDCNKIVPMDTYEKVVKELMTLKYPELKKETHEIKEKEEQRKEM